MSTGMDASWPEEEYTHARFPRATIALMTLGASSVMASVIALVAVVPEAARDLQATQAEISLIIDVTAVALGALVLPMGGLLDRYGRRKGLIVGFSGMLAALIWSYLASSPGEMIAARVATGVFAAVAFPGTLATLTSTMPPERKRFAVAAWTGGVMIGGTYGLLIAGACGEWFGWRDQFLALGAIVAVSLIGTLIVVPETRGAKHVNLDPVAGVLALIGVGALTMAVIQLPARGLADPLVFVGFGVGVMTIAAFLLWEVRTRAPMLPVRLFGTNYEFAIATGAAFLLFFATYGWFFLSFQFYVYALGFSPLGAAAGLIQNIVVTVPAALAGPRLASRYGWRSVVTFAFIVGAISFLFIAIAGQWLSFLPIAFGFALFGVALGLPQAPATEAIIDALPPSKQGIASAVNDASRELGAAFGIAIFGSLFNAGYRAKVAGYHGPAPPDVLETVKDSPALGSAVAEKLGAHGGTELQQLVENATADGWTTAFVAGAVFFAFAAYFVWRHAPRPVRVAAAVASDRAPVQLSPSEAALVPAGKYSLNHATSEQLREAGMSVTQAKRVIVSREVDGAFTSVDELDRVPGFSPTSLAELKQVLVVPLQHREEEPEITTEAETPESARTPSI